MSLLKSKMASGLGSVIEWYDFALYGFFASILGKLYYPSTTTNIELLKVFSVFAIGFLARPLGALLFGYIADTKGRVISLKLTPILITCPTLILSVLPTYQSIGLLAPATMIFLRFWQGLCIGGEYANNIIYLCESSKSKHIYFWGSISSCISSLGILLASCVATFLYNFLDINDLVLYGWRVGFGLSSILGVTTFFLRKNMLETPVFSKRLNEKKLHKNPIKVFFKHQYKLFFVAIGLAILPAVAFNYCFVFLPNFLSSNLNINTGDALNVNSISLFFRLLAIPLIGILSDLISGVFIARISCLLFATLSYFLLKNIISGVFNGTCFFCYIFVLLTIFNAGTTPGLLIELLGPETRSTGISFSLNIAFGTIGGIIPIICFLINNEFESKIASVFVLVFASAITLIATFYFKRIVNERKLLSNIV